MSIIDCNISFCNCILIKFIFFFRGIFKIGWKKHILLNVNYKRYFILLVPICDHKTQMIFQYLNKFHINRLLLN